MTRGAPALRAGPLRAPPETAYTFTHARAASKGRLQ
jgi:hypothetical protein